MNQSVPLRNVIFISHATPTDNDFTLWLGSRLSAAGYEVWSDVTKLYGGEYFWENIEEVIQSKAAKVIVVATKETKGRKGLMDEIQVAINTESTIDDKKSL